MPLSFACLDVHIAKHEAATSTEPSGVIDRLLEGQKSGVEENSGDRANPSVRLK